MDCGCISVLMKDELHPTVVDVLMKYQTVFFEDSIWFSIRVKQYKEDTPYGRNAWVDQLTSVFGKFPEQEVEICGQSNHIFIAAHEIIRCFGGLLFIGLGDDPEYLNRLPGTFIRLVENGPENASFDEEKAEIHLLNHIAIKVWARNAVPEEYERYSIDSYFKDSIDVSKYLSEN